MHPLLNTRVRRTRKFASFTYEARAMEPVRAREYIVVTSPHTSPAQATRRAVRRGYGTLEHSINVVADRIGTLDVVCHLVPEFLDLVRAHTHARTRNTHAHTSS